MLFSLLCASLFLAACSTPPKLPEPEGALVPINPVIEPQKPVSKQEAKKAVRIADAILLKPENLLPLAASNPKNPAPEKHGKAALPLAASTNGAKAIQSAKPITPKPAAPIWIAKAGSTLKDSIEQWARRANWQIIWDTKTDYPILVSVEFSGTFEQAASKFLNLYAGAQKPLMMGIQQQQHLLYISDTSK